MLFKIYIKHLNCILWIECKNVTNNTIYKKTDNTIEIAKQTSYKFEIADL